MGKTITECIKSAFFELSKEINTSIPAEIIRFYPDTQLADVQIAIKRKDSDGSYVNHPQLLGVPVHFAGGDWVLEHSISAGCVGIIVVSQRCIDGWIFNGGIAEMPHLRMHDKNDAIFIPGVRPQPKKIQDFANDGIRLRSKSGSCSVWIHEDDTVEMESNGHRIVLTGGGDCSISIGGALSISASDVSIDSGGLTHNGVNIGSDHKHSSGAYIAGSTPVTSTSGAPV